MSEREKEIARHIWHHIKQLSMGESETVSCGSFSVWIYRDSDKADDATIVFNNLSRDEGMPILEALRGIKDDAS